MALFVPTLVPFNFHWKEGVPPLTGVAVKITFVPEQIVVAVAAILTDGVTGGFTVITTLLDVAVACVTQLSDEAMTTDIASPFVSAVF